MDTFEPKQSPFISAHLPLTLLAIAATIFFASQLSSVRQSTDNMTWQSANADKQIKILNEGREALGKNIEVRKALVAQSEQLQKQFSDMMRELDELARSGDKDADLIVKTHGIKVNDPAPSTGGTPATQTPPPAATPAAEKPPGQ